MYVKSLFVAFVNFTHLGTSYVSLKITFLHFINAI